MSPNALQDSLLRPSILYILRAAGFNATRPAALDTLVDLASRYIVLLASQTASHAFANHNDVVPTVMDVRMALQDVGALRPQIGIMEEQSRNEEDTRGMDAFLKWMTGDESREIRRIAGMVGSEGDVDVEAGSEREDFLTGKSSQTTLQLRETLLMLFHLKHLKRSIARLVKNLDSKAPFSVKARKSSRSASREVIPRALRDGRHN